MTNFTIKTFFNYVQKSKLFFFLNFTRKFFLKKNNKLVGFDKLICFLTYFLKKKI